MTERAAVLAIDQGTTNSKAVLVTADGAVLATGSAPVGLATPQPGWAEQDADDLWQSVLTAISSCLATAGAVEIAGIALSTQRESVVGWNRRGEAVGPVIGWQDVRTTDWCSTLPPSVDELVRERTGLRVDAMFSAPKLHWLLEQAAPDHVGTVDSWLIHRLTGCREHLTDAGNAARTLLYDVLDLDWSTSLLDAFGVPKSVLPEVRASNGGFGTTSGVPGLRDGIPIVAVLADSHAAMYGQGCTEAGMIKATYGTGSSVMTPVDAFVADGCTLAWLTDEPLYALEGNIVSSGAALAWTASLLGLSDVGALVELAATVPSAGDVVLVPAFAGLGAPHWDRNARAALTGMGSSTTRAHVARACVDAVAHQICDIVDTIPGTPDRLRADGGATVSDLLMQTQADLLGHPVEAADVAEISALGTAELAWTTLNHPRQPGHLGQPGRDGHPGQLGQRGRDAAGDSTAWAATRPTRLFEPTLDADSRAARRTHWSNAVRTVRTTSA